MSVFGPSGIAGAPLTEVKPGESWVANAPLVTDALVAQAIAEHPWRPDRWVERFARDARAFVGSLTTEPTAWDPTNPDHLAAAERVLEKLS